MVKYFLFFYIFLDINAFAQKITYAEPLKKDKSLSKFEIIGKYGKNTLIYKNTSGDHHIDIYDNQMNLVVQKTLDFLPVRIIDYDFIVYQDHFYLIYQYQKNKTVYCRLADFDAGAELIKNPSTLDSVNISFLASNKVYSLTASEDKTRLLLGKRNIKNKKIDLSVNLYNAMFEKTGSFQQQMNTNQRREIFSDFYVDNKGRFSFLQSAGNRIEDHVDQLTLFVYDAEKEMIKEINIDLQGKTINYPLIKIDNLNNQYLINAFYYGDDNLHTEGLFTVKINPNSYELKKSAFNAYYVSNKNSTNTTSAQYDNLIPKNILLKKSGGFMLIAEDFYAESYYDNNRWNRYDPYSPFNSTGDYYLYSPYSDFYRPYYNNTQTRMRYYYHDIVISDIDSNLVMNWNNSVHKRQIETDNENSLSFCHVLSGKYIHFLFVEDPEQKALITDNQMDMLGVIKKSPLIRNEEKDYEFMPRMAKQTGAGMIVIPFLYQNKLGFAKIEY